MVHKGEHKGCYILHKGYYMIFCTQSQHFVFPFSGFYDIIKDAIFRKKFAYIY